MIEDFTSAAVRHFRDGDLLGEHDRLPNADQLYGFAAECGLKAALGTLASCTDQGTLAGRYREHVDRLWDLARLQSLQLRFPGLAAVLSGLQQPFSDWSVAQRYGPDNEVTGDAVVRHRKAAARVLGSTGLSGALTGG